MLPISDFGDDAPLLRARTRYHPRHRIAQLVSLLVTRLHPHCQHMDLKAKGFDCRGDIGQRMFALECSELTVFEEAAVFVVFPNVEDE